MRELATSCEAGCQIILRQGNYVFITDGYAADGAAYGSVPGVVYEERVQGGQRCRAAHENDGNLAFFCRGNLVFYREISVKSIYKAGKFIYYNKDVALT